jgi:hypothetical protein
MSTTLSNIPKGATLIVDIQGTINSPGEENHGKPASARVYQDFVGGDTLTQWLVLRVEGVKLGGDRTAWVKRASGRNIAKLQAELADIRQIIRVAPEASKLTAAQIDKGIEDAALLCERAAGTTTAPGDVIAWSAADHLRLQLNPYWHRQSFPQAVKE